MDRHANPISRKPTAITEVKSDASKPKQIPKEMSKSRQSVMFCGGKQAVQYILSVILGDLNCSLVEREVKVS
jgi:hypothetical protein